MTFREDGRVQGLIDENAALKKVNVDLAKKYADASRIPFRAFLVAAVLCWLSGVTFDRAFFSNRDSKIVREVVALIRQNPRVAYDRQSATYLKEKIVMPAYHEGVRDAREEFEASRRAETSALPVVSAEGRDLTEPPTVPVLPLNQVIYGRISGGDIESYLFHARAGERVVFRMQATVGSHLIPWFKLTTKDTREFLKDSVDPHENRYTSFEYTFESTGTYIILCHYWTHEYGNSGSYALSARHQ